MSQRNSLFACSPDGREEDKRKVRIKLTPTEDIMSINEVRKKAKGMGINTYRLKKSDIIHSIQRVENNIECFGTQRVDYCCEHDCLWRNDCILLNNHNS